MSSARLSPPQHLLSESQIFAFRKPTSQDPFRLMVSACLAMEKCGVRADHYGEFPSTLAILKLPNVRPVRFCPEFFSFGVPRNMPDIHGGNGFDVLDGKARVITDKGEDWTQGFLQGAQEMLRIAQSQKVELALLMDMSAACGSQVISDGNRMVPQEQRKWQKGPGVSAALLMRNGIRVVSQRDFLALELLRAHLDSKYVPDRTLRNHHQTDWYLGYFGNNAKQ